MTNKGAGFPSASALHRSPRRRRRLRLRFDDDLILAEEDGTVRLIGLPDATAELGEIFVGIDDVTFHR
jgi:hypothetical protein